MIINSLLDTDFYKFTMGQYAWKYYPNVKVKYAFINRTKVKLAENIHIPDLIRELDQVRNIKFTMEELNYLNSLGIFSKNYLIFLSTLKMPPVYVSEEKGQLVIETEGKWSEAIFWETFILSIVNEMYYQAYGNTPIGYLGNFQDNLVPKMDRIIANPFKFVEFGTRRRFSQEIQYSLLTMMENSEIVEVNALIGTSNVYLAKHFKLKPIGTMAHELSMVCAGLNDESLYTLEHSHNKMLDKWYFMYGEDLSIALTDTFGTDFFFKDFTKEKAEQWKGLRQDSGDPIEFFYKALEFYEDYNIDPKEKLIIFSDGLNIDKIYEIEKAVAGRMKTAYGWGTNLTNDVGAEPLSIVVKATMANGKKLVKLSDNTAKALGDPKVIEKYKRAFGYKSTYEEPLYY